MGVIDTLRNNPTMASLAQNVSAAAASVANEPINAATTEEQQVVEPPEPEESTTTTNESTDFMETDNSSNSSSDDDNNEVIELEHHKIKTTTQRWLLNLSGECFFLILFCGKNPAHPFQATSVTTLLLMTLLFASLKAMKSDLNSIALFT